MRIKQKLVIAITVVLATCATSIAQVVTTYFTLNTARDVLVLSDNSVITIHSTTDSSQMTGELIFYSFDDQLVLVDSLILDSAYYYKTLVTADDKIYVAKSKKYSNYTASIVLYKMDRNFIILQETEFYQDSIYYGIVDLTEFQDSLLVYSVVNDHGINAVYREFMVDTLFQSIHPSSCSVLRTNQSPYYNNTAITTSNSRIHANVTGFGFYPEYHVFDTNQSCSNIDPFTPWNNFVTSTTNFSLGAWCTNSIFSLSSGLVVPTSGENNDINNFAVAGIIKTDENLNAVNSFFAVPNSGENDLTPFRLNSIAVSGSVLLLAANTNQFYMNQNAYVVNKIRIEYLDTALNSIASRSVNPLGNRVHNGKFIRILPDGGILLFGNSWNENPPYDASFFLVKYSSISELLSVSERSELELSLTVFPNPSTGIFTFSIPKNEMIETVTVFNSTGQKVMSCKSFTSSIDLSNFNAGIYFVEVVSGNKVYRTRVVKY